MMSCHVGVFTEERMKHYGPRERVKDQTRIFISIDEDKHLDIEIKIEIYFQRYMYLKIDLKDINKDIKYFKK